MDPKLHRVTVLGEDEFAPMPTYYEHVGHPLSAREMRRLGDASDIINSD